MTHSTNNNDTLRGHGIFLSIFINKQISSPYEVSSKNSNYSTGLFKNVSLYKSIMFATGFEIIISLKIIKQIIIFF